VRRATRPGLTDLLFPPPVPPPYRPQNTASVPPAIDASAPGTSSERLTRNT
jgi:hypothetical protein